MAENAVVIEKASIFDNIGDRRVEFRGNVDGESYEFGVRYSVIEALTGMASLDEPAQAFAAVADEVAAAALTALARSNGDVLIVISENDLDQTA